MGVAEVIVAILATGGVISLLAIYMEYKSKGVTVFGSGRRMRKHELERLENEVKTLSERVASLTENVIQVREQLADLILDSHGRVSSLTEARRALEATRADAAEARP